MLGVEEFAAEYLSKGYSSCWGSSAKPLNLTTYAARTFLQPQLQKAVRASEMESKGDVNPKDFILFPAAKFAHVSTARDNTGRRRFDEGTPFPTLGFPSDHAIVSCTLYPAYALQPAHNMPWNHPQKHTCFNE